MTIRYLAKIHFAASVSLAITLLSVPGFAQSRPSHVPGRLLVKFKKGVGPAQAQRVTGEFRARDDGELASLGIRVLSLPPDADDHASEKAFRKRGEVEFAELDRYVEPAVTPNDPSYSSQWHLPKISAPEAWSLTTGNSAVVVAILDTGVDATHPDLASKLVPGWNTKLGTSDTTDVYGHGTKVAGTAAAIGNNGLGVASVCWNCLIMPVKVSGDDGYATYSAIASGLTWAADRGAHVANISYMVTTSSTVTSAAQYFWNKGGVVASSAGNYSTFDTSADNPYILTVSGSDENDLLYSWSNTGNNVDLAAPGCVYTTVKGGGYASACGTSFSAPITAGVAALLFSMDSSLSPSQVTTMLKQSADDRGMAGWDPSYGWGRINAAQAVAAVGSSGRASDTQAPAVSITAPASGATVSGTATVLVSATDNVGVTGVSLYVDGSLVSTDSTAPYSFSWNTTSAGNGAHTLEATAVDAAGNSASHSVSVTVNNFTAASDTSAPSVAITSPTQGSKVSKTVSVKAAVRDNVAVVKVALYVDGVLRGSSTTAPFTIRWNANKLAAGPHSLTEKAYDAAGNTGESAAITVYK